MCISDRYKDRDGGDRSFKRRDDQNEDDKPRFRRDFQKRDDDNGGDRRGGGRKPGNWICPGCSNDNFSFRTECQKCQEPKPEGAGDNNGGGDRRGGDRNGDGGDRRGGGSKPGTWICASCSNDNFAFRTECKRCQEPKPEGAGGNDGDSAGGRGRGRPRDGEDVDRERKGSGDRDGKPREIYIPPEPTNDEAEMFGAGVKTGINFDKYDDIEVNVSENIATPIKTFADGKLRDLLLTNLQKSGYTKPTPIQRYAIPTIIGGRDLMGCAQTGSGKTAAFLLPMLNKLMEDFTWEPFKPKCIIVSPTRELAIQIFNEARKFALGSPLKVAIAYGGTAVRYQNETISKGCHVLVATPGRLNDFVERGWISLDAIQFVVLDEADRKFCFPLVLSTQTKFIYFQECLTWDSYLRLKNL